MTPSSILLGSSLRRLVDSKAGSFAGSAQRRPATVSLAESSLSVWLVFAPAYLGPPVSFCSTNNLE